MAKNRSQRIKNNIESVKNIIQRDIKQDRESFITPEYLKRALDALSAFTPEESDRKMLYKAIDIVFTKNFVIKYINQAYRFIFNKPEDYLDEKKDVKSHVKYISKEIGKEVDTLMEDTKTKGKIVAANEQIKIINYLRTDIMPVLEKYYKKVLFFKSEEDIEATPELVSNIVKKLEKTKRSKVKFIKKAGAQKDISKGSAGDYTDGGSWLESVANDFKMLTHYDKIFTIWDKIISEIDKWS